jgi:hypothetical protein
MNVFRTIITLSVLFVSFCFLYWIPFSFFPFEERNVFSDIFAFLCAAAISWVVWVKLKTRGIGPISCTFLGAVLLGALGFSAGFFGPLLFAPEANQGPLLGIFITGPLGFIVGGIAGLTYWYRRIRHEGEKGS